MGVAPACAGATPMCLMSTQAHNAEPPTHQAISESDEPTTLSVLASYAAHETGNTARPTPPPKWRPGPAIRLPFRMILEPKILMFGVEMEYVVTKRHIVLGGLATMSALATSVFAAGAAFAASSAPAQGLPAVTHEAAGLSNLQMVSGLLPVAGGTSGLSGLLGSASGLGLLGGLTQASPLGSALPTANDQKDLTGSNPVDQAGTLSGATGTIGSLRSASPLGDSSGLTGELPNVASGSGLLQGAAGVVPVLGALTGSLG